MKGSEWSLSFLTWRGSLDCYEVPVSYQGGSKSPERRRITAGPDFQTTRLFELWITDAEIRLTSER